MPPERAARQTDRKNFPRRTTWETRPGRYWLIAAACVLAFALYAADVPDNPPGFYIDESSIAYNAHTISQTGRDEYGAAWPLYFRAFGDYKNPTFIYLVAVLFLLALWRASAKERWTVTDVLALAATLALLTYSYSIGRLLGPLLAAGLAFFITRRNLSRVLATLLAYALTLAPLFAFDWRNPGALTRRFKLLTYATPQSTLAADALEFARHYLADINPWRWLVNGELNIRDHVSGAGALLAATVLLAAFGLVLVLRGHLREA